MAVGILVMLFVNHPPLPELTDGLANKHPENLPIFPIMFVSIACGAISGFHATQSPLMARCIKSEKMGRPVFFGAMITEGIVALIWAAAATYFYHNNGMGESNAAVIVDSITKECELLSLLCAHANEILERNYALKTIWVDDNYFNARSMDVYITKLRKLLKDDPGIEIINIHGKGYKLITPSGEEQAREEGIQVL